jgi:ribonuclease VapC
VIAIDSSAVISILRGESDGGRFADAITDADAACMSAVSLQESSMVLAGRTGDAVLWLPLDELIRDMNLEIVAHDADLARVAHEAFLRFGKGRHRARLNFGDCASYALAKTRDVPLLFKGSDFARTDIVPAIAAPA